jgi:hypothetical protein
MDINKLFPQYLIEKDNIGVICETIGKVFTEIQDDASKMTDIIDFSTMPTDLLYQWLKLNNIPISYDSNKDIRSFKRYYALLKTRGTKSAVETIIRTGGGIYTPPPGTISISNAIEKTFHYNKKLVYDGDHIFDGDQYSFGVWHLATNNADLITKNALLNRVLPAGVKFFIISTFFSQYINTNDYKIYFDYEKWLDFLTDCSTEVLSEIVRDFYYYVEAFTDKLSEYSKILDFSYTTESLYSREYSLNLDMYSLNESIISSSVDTDYSKLVISSDSGFFSRQNWTFETLDSMNISFNNYSSDLMSLSVVKEV